VLNRLLALKQERVVEVAKLGLYDKWGEEERREEGGAGPAGLFLGNIDITVFRIVVFPKIFCATSLLRYITGVKDALDRNLSS